MIKEVSLFYTALFENICIENQFETNIQVLVIYL